MNLLPVAFVLLLTVVQSFAQTKCCMPNQSSMVMTALATINGGDLGLLNAQIDHDRQMQVLVNVSFSPDTGKWTENSYTLFDYKQKIIYYVPGNDTSKCYKLPNTQALVQCIPDDAQYLGSNYLGPMGNSLDYDGWRFKLDVEGGLIVTIAMARKDCVPIVEGVNVLSNPAGNLLFLFSEFKPQLVDPSKFDLPPSCKQK